MAERDLISLDEVDMSPASVTPDDNGLISLADVEGPASKYAKKPNKKKDPTFTENLIDVGKSSPTGLVKGVNSVLGLPADVKNLSDVATRWLLSKGAEVTGLVSPEQGARLRAGPDYGPPDTFEPGGKALQDYLPSIPAPTSDNLNRGVFSLTQALGMPEHVPQTTAGEYAKTISEFAPGAVAFGGPGVMSRLPSAVAKYGVLPGAVSETAGQATAGTPQEPWARAAGAIVGSAPGIINDIVRAPSRQMRHALDGISDETLNKAQALVDESRQAGPPLSLAEAVQYVTNGATGLGDLERAVIQTRSGANVYRPFYAERPIKSEKFAKNELDRIYAAPSAPETVPGRVQSAADAVIQGTPEAQVLRDEVFATGPRTTAEDAGNVIQTELQGVRDRREGMRAALAEPDYAAARAADYGANGAPMNPVNVMPVVSYIDDLLASAKGVNARVLRQARGLLFAEGTPDMTVTGLDGARKAITPLIEEQLRKGNKYGAEQLQDVIGQLDNALERVPAYGQARRNFAAASEPLEPFAAGKVPGQIVKRDQYGNEFVMPTEKVAPAIEKGGPTAADDFLKAAENSPDSRAAFSRYYTQKLLDSATDQTGNISADALANQVRQNEDMLRRFPEIRVQLDRIGAARNEFGNIERSVVGELANASDFDKQVSILFGTNPTPGSHVEMGRAVKALVAHDPDPDKQAVKQVVRMYLEQQLNKAFTKLHGMPNQSGGWKFTNAIQGNPQQRENLRTVIEALPDGKIRYNAFNKAIRIMEAQGARPNIGSSTFGNTEAKEGLQEVSKVAEGVSNFYRPLKWGDMINHWRIKMLYEKNGDVFADIFTRGNVADLRKLAASPAGGVQGAKVLANILTPRMKDDENGVPTMTITAPKPPGFALGGSVNADLLPLFQSASEETGVPLPVLLAVAKQESNFDPKVTSSTGGRGIMQVQPSTAVKPGFGVAAVNPDSLYDPATNISFGAKYLAAVGRSAGVKDWNDPNEAAKGLLRYNGGGDPNYVKNVGRHLPGYENMRTAAPEMQMAQIDEPEAIEEPIDYEISEDTPVSSGIQQDENSIMGLPSYVWAILDPAYKKQLLQMGINNGTVSEKQAMALLNVRPAFAEGGLVEADNPSTAEPQLDMNAQAQAVQDPQAGKDTMFIAKGSQYPQDIPVGTIIVRRPEGDLVTTSLEKAAEFLQTPQLTDQTMAELLGYPEAKSEVTDPVVVQGVEPSGGVSTEMLSSPDKTEEAVKAVLKQSPTAALGILSPDQAQQRRRVAMMGGMV